MHWPQLIWLTCIGIGCVNAHAFNGQSRQGNFVVHMVKTAFFAWLLYCGNFFG